MIAQIKNGEKKIVAEVNKPFPYEIYEINNNLINHSNLLAYSLENLSDKFLAKFFDNEKNEYIPKEYYKFSDHTGIYIRADFG